ncbi:MAG: glycosyl transferase family 1 [Bacteroidales bacterium]|nr:glycosyl transferase family 1 [Tenuifilaceae bacterium]
MQKRVLIITYYWPPSGGSGVQRWLKFCKYLQSYGWNPVIYTPENPDVSVTDKTLASDIPSDIKVIKREIFEPYSLFRFFARQKKGMGVGFASAEGKKNGLFGKLSLWVRANLFIPDARIFWVNPSVRFLANYLKNNPVDAVISTGPPHSMHLIALKLKQRMGIKWLADFRDPWTSIDYMADLPITKRSLQKHKRLENKVVTMADEVVVVSSQMQAEFEQVRPQGVSLITNGFDHTDFAEHQPPLDSEFTITHLGSIPANRNSEHLWDALSRMIASDALFASKLKIQLVGSVDKLVADQIKHYGLAGHCTFTGYVNHTKSIEIMQRSQVLLLLVNQSANAKGILTGKVFEYLAARRPILAIGPTDGDVSNLLKQTKAGVTANFCSFDDIYHKLKWMWGEYQNGFPFYDKVDVSEYSRKNLTGKLVDKLNHI